MINQNDFGEFCWSTRRERFDLNENSWQILGHFDLFGLCLRSATRCDSIDSASSTAILPTPEIRWVSPSRQQSFAALLRSLHVRNITQGTEFRPYWVHRTSTQPQPWHRRAVVLRSRLHYLRGALYQRRSIDHSLEMPWQQLLLPRQQFEAPNVVLEGARPERECQSTRLRHGKRPTDARVQSSVASFVGHFNATRNDSTLHFRAVSTRRSLRGRRLQSEGVPGVCQWSE